MDAPRLREESQPKSKQISDYKKPKRNIDVITWPGTDTPVGIKQLVASEQQEAYFRARAWYEANSQKVDDSSRIFFEMEYWYQLCLDLIVDPDTEARLFKTAKEVRSTLTQNEVEYFIEHFNRTQQHEFASWQGEEANPHLRDIASALGMDKVIGAELVEKINEIVAENRVKRFLGAHVSGS